MNPLVAAHLPGMSFDANGSKHESAGTKAGGRFAREALTESGTTLGAPTCATTVQVTGEPGPTTPDYVAAFEAIPGLGGVSVDVSHDGDRGFHATATVHGHDYEIHERFGPKFHVSAGAWPHEVIGSTRDRAATLLGTLQSARELAIAGETLKGVERTVRDEYASLPVAKHPVVLRRDVESGVTEVGFSLPGDHMKVRIFDQPFTGVDARSEGQLFASSPVTDGTGGLTMRQQTNRLNKVLDAIGPDRAHSEMFLRRYLALAQAEFDIRVSTDPLLTSKESA